MEFKEFIENVMAKHSVIINLESQYDYIDNEKMKKLSDIELDKLCIETSWVSGGMTGGSCYGQDNYHSVTPHEPEDISPKLSAIVRDIKPDLLMIEYFDEVHPLIKNTSFTNYEYYGNSYEYTRLYVNLKALYKVLFK